MGRHVVLVSEVTNRELSRAPLNIQQFAAQLPAGAVENVATTQEMVDLTYAYIAAGVVSRQWLDDAAQVAVATLSRADALVSWNFRHLVKLDKIRAFNAVNVRFGYPLITILSPREVISDEKEI